MPWEFWLVAIFEGSLLVAILFMLLVHSWTVRGLMHDIAAAIKEIRSIREAEEKLDELYHRLDSDEEREAGARRNTEVDQHDLR